MWLRHVNLWIYESMLKQLLNPPSSAAHRLSVLQLLGLKSHKLLLHLKVVYATNILSNFIFHFLFWDNVFSPSTKKSSHLILQMILTGYWTFTAKQKYPHIERLCCKSQEQKPNKKLQPRRHNAHVRQDACWGIYFSCSGECYKMFCCEAPEMFCGP